MTERKRKVAKTALSIFVKGGVMFFSTMITLGFLMAVSQQLSSESAISPAKLFFVAAISALVSFAAYWCDEKIAP